MDENTTPDNGGSALESALKQIQSWFVSGEFEKVKRGCEEVLKVSPNNSIAQDLLKKAEEALNAPQAGAEAATPEATPQPTSDPEAPMEGTQANSENGEDTDGNGQLVEDPETSGAPAPTPEPAPSPDLNIPDASAGTAETASAPAQPTGAPEAGAPMPDVIPTGPADAAEAFGGDSKKRRTLVINIGILIAMIVVGIIIVYGYQALTGGDEETQVTSDTQMEQHTAQQTHDDKDDKPGKGDEKEEKDEDSMESRNAARLSNLNMIESALVLYYDSERQYPDAEEINDVLVDEGWMDEIPQGPNEDDQYLYAVYHNALGENQVYILTAYFETEDGEKEVWTTGGNTSEYDDYEEVEQPHVTTLGVEEPEQEESTPVRIPRS